MFCKIINNAYVVCNSVICDVRQAKLNTSRSRNMKSHSVIVLCVLFLLGCVPLHVTAQHRQSYNREGWVNPDDMLNYDRVNKRMKNTNNGQDLMTSDHKMCQTSLRQCQESCENNNLESTDARLRETLTENKSVYVEEIEILTEDQNRMYVRRFVNLLMIAADVSDSNPDHITSKEIKITGHITSSQLRVLQSYGSREDSDISLQKLDQVFSEVFSKPTSSWIRAKTVTLFESISHYIMKYEAWHALPHVLVVVLTCLTWSSGRGLRKTLTTFAVTILLTAFLQYYSLIKQRLLLDQYIVMKHTSRPPPECTPDWEMSWWSWLFSAPSSADRCRKYYETVQSDPAASVTTLTVVCEMFEKMSETLGNCLGSSYARFAATVLGKLPFFTNMIVLSCGLLFALGLVLVWATSCVGGVLRLPFWLGALEVGRRQDTPQIQQPSANLAVQPPHQQHIHIHLHDKARSSDTQLVPVVTVNVTEAASAGHLTPEREVAETLPQSSVSDSAQGPEDSGESFLARLYGTMFRTRVAEEQRVEAGSSTPTCDDETVEAKSDARDTTGGDFLGVIHKELSLCTEEDEEGQVKDDREFTDEDIPKSDGAEGDSVTSLHRDFVENVAATSLSESEVQREDSRISADGYCLSTLSGVRRRAAPDLALGVDE